MIQDLRQPCSFPMVPERISGQQPQPMQEQFSLHADNEATVLATQSVFPSCISLNKGEVSLISSGFGLFGVMHSRFLCPSWSNTPIPVLLIHITQKTRLTHNTSSLHCFLPTTLPSLSSFFFPFCLSVRKRTTIGCEIKLHCSHHR